MESLEKFIILIVLILVSVLFGGCFNTHVYQNSITFDNDTWTYQDSMVCQFTMSDTTQRYDLLLTLEHGDLYPYQNFYLKINTLFPDKKLFSQSVSLEMADASGRWLGETSGKKVKLRIPIQEAAIFRPPGDYRITFIQDMRVSSMSGLHSLSFMVVPSTIK